MKKHLLKIKQPLTKAQMEGLAKQWNEALRKPGTAVVCGPDVDVIELDIPRKAKFPLSLITHCVR